uniref:Uncharacterized protein n=1 Tax=Arundo donax TaxID=35708 RepID=A0A0A9BV10_ARUDO
MTDSKYSIRDYHVKYLILI